MALPHKTIRTTLLLEQKRANRPKTPCVLVHVDPNDLESLHRVRVTQIQIFLALLEKSGGRRRRKNSFILRSE